MAKEIEDREIDRDNMRAIAKPLLLDGCDDPLTKEAYITLLNRIGNKNSEVGNILLDCMIEAIRKCKEDDIKFLDDWFDRNCEEFPDEDGKPFYVMIKQDKGLLEIKERIESKRKELVKNESDEVQEDARKEE